MGATWLDRHASAMAGALGLGLLAALVLIGVLFIRLEQTREDLERVEGGALLATVQVQAFRDQLAETAPAVASGIDDAIAGLEGFGESSLEFEVAVDETVPIDTEIAFEREFVVPVQTSIPIEQTIATTIEVQGPLGVAVPIDVEVPVDIEVPVDVELTLRVEETVPFVADVPVRLNLPVEIFVGDTGLAELADSLALGLVGFRDVFASFEE